MLQSELLEFLEETADAGFCVSQQGDICSWNSAAERLFGYSASEAIGKACHGLLQCRGSLGAKLCTREFYARQATVEQCRIPNFHLEVTVRSGRRIWVDFVYPGIQRRANPPASYRPSFPRYHRKEAQ
jgi:PAS domain S-box-containing protein